MRNRSINSTRLISPPLLLRKIIANESTPLPPLSLCGHFKRSKVDPCKKGGDEISMTIISCESARVSRPLPSPLEDYAAAQRYRVWIRVISVN